jgi:phosphonate transport system substrate-binding protein
MTPIAKRVLAALALAVSATLAAACSSGSSSTSGAGRNPDTLVFASIPAQESSALEQAYQPVVALLEKETGKKIKFQKATDYAAVIEAQRAGKVDIAQYGPLSYVLARQSGVKATAVGAQINTKGATPGYQSYAVVPAGSPIKDLAGFKGKKVCFVDPDSTSGYLYPKAGLIGAGVNPDKDITPVMAGGHDASALSVAHGQCDAGFAYDNIVDHTLIDKGQLSPGQLTVVWKSAIIPGNPVAVSDDLDPAIRTAITKAFQEKVNVDYLKSSGICTGKCTIGDTSVWGYAPVDDTFYNPIREVCTTTKDKQCQAA